MRSVHKVRKSAGACLLLINKAIRKLLARLRLAGTGDSATLSCLAWQRAHSKSYCAVDENISDLVNWPWNEL